MLVGRMVRTFTAIAAIGLVSGAAFAERVQALGPPPGDSPESGASPGTGAARPTDPTNVDPLPVPDGKSCGTDGRVAPDQGRCDVGHGADQNGKFPGNKPRIAPFGQDDWYKDMYRQLYGMQQSLAPMISWSSAAGQASLSYYAQWMQTIVSQVGNMAFSGPPAPSPSWVQTYPFGVMTRGDFNYYFYYWIRPLYWNLLFQAQSYVSSSGVSPQYQEMMMPIVSMYQKLSACMYGFNGNDRDALRDYEARAEERKAGIRVGD